MIRKLDLFNRYLRQLWIVDYAGLVGVRHIGRPKQPAISICMLVDGEYEISQIRRGEIVPKSLSLFSSVAQQSLLNRS